MTMKFSPETFPTIECHAPVLSNAIAATCQPIYLGNADGVWLMMHEDYAVDGTQLVLTFREGATEAIALAGTYAVTATWGGWKNITAQTSDVWTALTAAATFALDGEAGGNNCMWAFYVPSIMLTDGYDWLHPTFADGNGGNYVSAMYILDGFRYKQATPPTAM